MGMAKKRKRGDLGDVPPPTPISRPDPGYVPKVDDTPMSAKQLAEFLGVHPVTIRRQLRGGGIPHFRVGNRVRFLPGEVIQWLRKKPSN